MRFQEVAWVVVIAGLLSGCAYGSLDGLEADPGLSPFGASADESEDLSERFERRVQATFPPGTPVSDMLDRLEAAGFEVDLERRDARLPYGIIPACNRDYIVQWTGDPLLESVDAFHYSVCL